ncbi:MAG TPA: hypothetical protein VHI52_19455 [Verrucomicrobiae bacterium]|nr:hypothetical protein [Verrucomicrobiae bacterium]
MTDESKSATEAQNARRRGENTPFVEAGSFDLFNIVKHLFGVVLAEEKVRAYDGAGTALRVHLEGKAIDVAL